MDINNYHNWKIRYLGHRMADTNATRGQCAYKALMETDPSLVSDFGNNPEQDWQWDGPKMFEQVCSWLYMRWS